MMSNELSQPITFNLEFDTEFSHNLELKLKLEGEEILENDEATKEIGNKLKNGSHEHENKSDFKNEIKEIAIECLKADLEKGHPIKGILKPSTPVGTFTRRSTILFKHSRDKLMELVTNRSNANIEVQLPIKDLKRVRFSVPLRTTSIINKNSVKSQLEIASSNKLSTAGETLEWYVTNCRSREESTNRRVIQILEEAITTNKVIESINLSGERFPSRSIVPLADVLPLLNKLTCLELDDCSLDDESIKGLTPHLLATDRIKKLSLTNNKFRSEGMKFIATYLNQSKTLRTLDLSHNPIDTKGMTYLAKGLVKESNQLAGPTELSLIELKLNHCSLKTWELKILSTSISRSTLSYISLTSNHVSSLNSQHLIHLVKPEVTLNLPTLNRLTRLILNANQLKNEGLLPLLSGIKSPNCPLEELNISGNLINEHGMVQLCQALETNRKLKTLDLSQNSVCGPLLDGLLALKRCLTRNNTLSSLFLSETGLTSEGAVTLAETLPETNSLQRLDLALNNKIGTAGLMALTISLKLNYSVTCLEVSVPPNRPELSQLAQDIMSACVRNTQLKDNSTSISE